MYLMNGLVLGTWCRCALEEDMCRPAAAGAAAFMLAHNVASPEEVEPLLDRLAQAGGLILRHADAPTHGGIRGYVVDPDNHAWEIIWNPVWAIDDRGGVNYRQSGTPHQQAS